MQTIESNRELRQIIVNARKEGKRIGFVPTMGFLHEGHLSLMRRARQENDVVVVSIFVNPTQFGPNEDLDAYPRDTERDCKMMSEESVDIAYLPTVETIYPEGFTTYVQVEGPMTQVLCGRSRPTHFRGVTTVVAKLFNLVQPHRAYFGQKDAQQAAIIQQMVRDLNFDLSVVVCPIHREPDGLAMSSRNTYLTAEQRAAATVLYQSLCNSKAIINDGERDAASIKKQIQEQILTVPGAVIDYVAIVDARGLQDVDSLSGLTLIALAVKFGNTRLLDNIQINV